MPEPGDATAASSPEAETLRVLFPSAIGSLGIELRGETITRLVIEPQGEEAARFTRFEQLDGSEFLDEVFGRLSEYFAGARKSLHLAFDLAPSGLPRFDAKVLHEVAKIPYGRTRTYQKVATAAGQPDGYRQVLAVLLENPIPIVIPCHRVVTNKSGVGSYIAGKDKKRWLLELEKEHLEEAV
jgi:methylated-DNA-[protein]-cysteine S-methyltransferase